MRIKTSRLFQLVLLPFCVALLATNTLAQDKAKPVADAAVAQDKQTYRGRMRICNHL